MVKWKNLRGKVAVRESKKKAAMCLHEWSKNNSDVLARGLVGTNTKKPPEPMMTQAAI